MGVGFFGKLFSKGSKVSPTIKSVKPSTTVTKKGVKASIDKTRSDEYRKRYTALDKSEAKVQTGKKMMQEGQKERKRMVDTGRAFQFKHSKSFHAVKPGEKRDTSLMKKPKKQKRFYTGKELEQQDYFNKGKGREKKMGGGMMGRRFGMKSGTNPFKKETNVEKIKKTFAPKGKIKFDAKKSDLDKSGSLSPYEKRRGMAIAKAMAKRKKKV
tara:strand:+ start:40 stop:675 length:636 start_codon:yes stop_codon:yes gene_type:complete